MNFKAELTAMKGRLFSPELYQAMGEASTQRRRERGLTWKDAIWRRAQAQLDPQQEGPLRLHGGKGALGVHGVQDSLAHLPGVAPPQLGPEGRLLSADLPVFRVAGQLFPQPEQRGVGQKMKCLVHICHLGTNIAHCNNSVNHNYCSMQ